MMVAFVLYFLLRLIGASPPAAEPLYLLLLFIFANCFGFAFGMLLASLALLVPVLKSVNRVFMRVIRLASGTFFVVPELPIGIRDYFLWNPLLHMSELVRTHYFVQYTTDYGDLGYMLRFFVVTLFLSLLLERLVRHRVGRGI